MSLSRTKASLQGKMLDAQSLQSVTIDYLRFPMALAVVFIHSKGEPTIALPDYAHFAGTDFFNLLRIVMSNVLTSVAVPTFFLSRAFFISLMCLYLRNLSTNEKRVADGTRLFFPISSGT